MAGTILRLLHRTDLNFNSLQGNGSVTVWLKQNIDVSRYREGTLLVRAHSLTIGVGASLAVALRAVLPTQEDPAQFFRSTADLISLSPVAAPTLLVGVLPANFGGYVSLLIRPTQPPTPVTLTATISVDLSLKD